MDPHLIIEKSKMLQLLLGLALLQCVFGAAICSDSYGYQRSRVSACSAKTDMTGCLNSYEFVKAADGTITTDPAICLWLPLPFPAGSGKCAPSPDPCEADCNYSGNGFTTTNSCANYSTLAACGKSYMQNQYYIWGCIWKNGACTMNLDDDAKCYH